MAIKQNTGNTQKTGYLKANGKSWKKGTFENRGSSLIC
jgi:hypothetical protein